MRPALMYRRHRLLPFTVRSRRKATHPIGTILSGTRKIDGLQASSDRAAITIGGRLRMILKHVPSAQRRVGGHRPRDPAVRQLVAVSTRALSLSQNFRERGIRSIEPRRGQKQTLEAIWLVPARRPRQNRPVPPDLVSRQLRQIVKHEAIARVVAQLVYESRFADVPPVQFPTLPILDT